MERNRGGRPRHPDVLTPAEWRVLAALREGGTNAEIAARLGVSTNTVRYHVSNMLAKLELRDRRALAAWRPEGYRGRLGALFTLPAAVWSVGRPLAWVGVGAAVLAGVVVVAVALVALEALVERDPDPPAAVAPPPAAPTPTTVTVSPGPALNIEGCSGVAVRNPEVNAELVADCEALLGLRDTIRGARVLDWTGSKAMSDWTGVTVSGTPQRVTALDLSGLGLDGELSGLLGNLTGLTMLDLSGNDLTGRVPSKLTRLTSLASISIGGTDLKGCVPANLRSVATSDVTLVACGPTVDMRERLRKDTPAPVGTFRIPRGRYGGDLILDFPDDTGLIFKTTRMLHGSIVLGTYGIVFQNAEGTVEFAIDVEEASEWPRIWSRHFTHEGTATGYTRTEYEAIFNRILESMWIEGE